MPTQILSLRPLETQICDQQTSQGISAVSEGEHWHQTALFQIMSLTGYP